MATTTKQFLTASDLQEITGRSAAYCYGIIRQLNAELKEQGYLVVRGQVQSRYFFRRFMLEDGDTV